MPPEEVVEALKRLNDELATNKQIFRVRLLDKGRTFSGDGALVYRSPDTLQMSIYGPPFTTLWMQLLSRGDSITVVLPKDNEKDMEEIPAHVKKDLQFHFIESADEAIAIALLPPKKPPTAKEEKPSLPMATHITGHA